MDGSVAFEDAHDGRQRGGGKRLATIRMSRDIDSTPQRTTRDQAGQLRMNWIALSRWRDGCKSRWDYDEVDTLHTTIDAAVRPTRP